MSAQGPMREAQAIVDFFKDKTPSFFDPFHNNIPHFDSAEFDYTLSALSRSGEDPFNEPFYKLMVEMLKVMPNGSVSSNEYKHKKQLEKIVQDYGQLHPQLAALRQMRDNVAKHVQALEKRHNKKAGKKKTQNLIDARKLLNLLDVDNPKVYGNRDSQDTYILKEAITRITEVQQNLNAFKNVVKDKSLVKLIQTPSPQNQQSINEVLKQEGVIEKKSVTKSVEKHAKKAVKQIKKIAKIKKLPKKLNIKMPEIKSVNLKQKAKNLNQKISKILPKKSEAKQSLGKKSGKKQTIAQMLLNRPTPKVSRIELLDTFATYDAKEFNALEFAQSKFTSLLEAEKKEYIRQQVNNRPTDGPPIEVFKEQVSAQFDEALRQGGYDLDELFETHGPDPKAILDAIKQARDACPIFLKENNKHSAFMNDKNLDELMAYAQDVNARLLDNMKNSMNQLQQLRGENGDPARHLMNYFDAKQQLAENLDVPKFKKWSAEHKAWTKFTSDMLVQGKLNKADVKKYNAMLWEGVPLTELNNPIILELKEKMSDMGFDSPELLQKKELSYQQVEKIATGTAAQGEMDQYKDQRKAIIKVMQLLEYAKKDPNFNFDAKIMTNKNGEKCSMIDFAIEYNMHDLVQVLKNVGAKPTIESQPIVDTDPNITKLRQVVLDDCAKAQTSMQDELKKTVHSVMKAHEQDEIVLHEPPSQLPPTENVKGILKNPGATQNKNAPKKVGFDLPEDKQQVRVSLPKEGREPPPKIEQNKKPVHKLQEKLSKANFKALKSKAKGLISKKESKEEQAIEIPKQSPESIDHQMSVIKKAKGDVDLTVHRMGNFHHKQQIYEQEKRKSVMLSEPVELQLYKRLQNMLDIDNPKKYGVLDKGEKTPILHSDERRLAILQQNLEGLKKEAKNSNAKSIVDKIDETLKAMAAKPLDIRAESKEKHRRGLSGGGSH